MEYMAIIDNILNVGLLVATGLHMFMAAKAEDINKENKHLLWAILALALIGAGAVI